MEEGEMGWEKSGVWKIGSKMAIFQNWPKNGPFLGPFLGANFHFSGFKKPEKFWGQGKILAVYWTLFGHLWKVRTGGKVFPAKISASWNFGRQKFPKNFGILLVKIRGLFLKFSFRGLGTWGSGLKPQKWTIFGDLGDLWSIGRVNWP